MPDAALVELQQTLAREMPICSAMGIRPVEWVDRRLAMEMPLEANRNHQYSAFAGSLNALCTVVGWGTVFLLLRGEGRPGNIVIRRSSIRYIRPVRQQLIVARSHRLDSEGEAYFYELLRSKGLSKIDVAAEIADSQGTLVSFQGSYVVQ
ncbi:MAG: YiiD C-terminal domain-containing protein [Pirellulales bacterium]|nr:YiiD C-terminal domain-containing protein [Pirellulales bacterium]